MYGSLFWLYYIMVAITPLLSIRPYNLDAPVVTEAAATLLMVVVVLVVVVVTVVAAEVSFDDTLHLGGCCITIPSSPVGRIPPPLDTTADKNI